MAALLFSNIYASDTLEDVKRSYEQARMRQENDSIPLEFIDLLQETLSGGLKFALTTQQREQLSLLKEEIGAAIHEHEDFSDFLKRNSLSSSITKETYADMFQYNPCKHYEPELNQAQCVYFHILQVNAIDKDFIYFCYQVIDRLIKDCDRLSEASINTFHKEIEVALNASAHTITEIIQTFFNVDYPGLLVITENGLFVDYNYVHGFENNVQDRLLFSLLIEHLGKIDTYNLDQFEKNVMDSIRSNSHIITHVPLLSTFNSTQLYLNIYKTISQIIGTKSEKIFIPRVTKKYNPSSIYEHMLMFTFDEGHFNNILTKLCDKKYPLTNQDRNVISRYTGSKLDTLILAKLKVDEHKIQQYILKIFPEVGRKQKPRLKIPLNKPTPQKEKNTKVKRPSLDQEHKPPSPLMVTQQQGTKPNIPTLTMNIDKPPKEEILTDAEAPLIMVPEAQIEVEDYVWDYEEWYRENILKYSTLNVIDNTPCNITISNILKIDRKKWSDNGNLFFEVVLGYISYQPLKLQHFNSFLKDAKGAKLKMTQRGYIQIKFEDESVETKYALPNLTSSRDEMPYFIFTVHQPHPGHEFPKRTIFEFLRPQLSKAGY